nr:MAG TPA: PsbA, PsbB, PsbC, PsbD, PsbE-FCP supercomplex, PLANT PROTEIN [Caudoviricetes sp.]
MWLIMFRPLRSWQRFMELFQNYCKKSRFLIQQSSPRLGNLL